MSTLTFPQALAQAEVLARQALPAALHERLACAVALVKEGRVFQASDGHWTVDSASTIGKTYSPNGHCDCEDVQFNKPPRDLCKHRLAVYVARKVAALMQVSEDLSTAQDAQECTTDAATTREPSAPAHAPTALPEAPVSITLKGTLHGQDVMVTLRGVDFASVKAQVEAAAQWLQAQAPATPAAGPGGTGKEWCSKHGVPMQHNDKHGRQWWSHRTADGQWCKGK